MDVQEVRIRHAEPEELVPHLMRGHPEH